MLNGLDLFSGYGGISRALSPWVRTVAYCENNTYRQLALLSEMQRNRIDRAPIWDDVSTPLRLAQLGRKGYLNPRFSERMMGLPSGSVKLKPWAAELFRKSQERRS
jgi:hypothetical protein